MIKKSLTIFTVMMCIIAATIGLIKKQTYTNLTAKEDGMDFFSVALWDNMIAPDLMELMRDELPMSNIILRVKAEGKVDHVFKLNKQIVEVLEVYKGNDIQVGDEIIITTSSWRYYFDDMTANMGFVNFMQKDNEYLIFLEEKIDALDPEDNNIYRVADYIIVPVFNYEDKDNTVIPVSDDNRYVPYFDVSKNEIFVSSNETLMEFMNLKHELIERYPK